MIEQTYILSNHVPDAVKQWAGNIRSISKETGVPYEILIAVMWVESTGNENAIGSDGEVGLMQLKEIAVQDVQQNRPVNTRNWKIDPVVNMLVGANYLSVQYDRTGTWEKAVKAYNQGESGAVRYPDRAESYWQKVKRKLDLLA